MIAEVEQPDETYVLEENGEPECGVDFCDVCGDCLSCYIGDPCYESTDPDVGHRWVIYLTLEERKRVRGENLE